MPQPSRPLLDSQTVPLGAGYAVSGKKVEIGVRPEFCTLTRDEGLPVKINRIEDVGRHKIVRARFEGHDVNIIAEEGQEVSADMTRVTFDPAHVNVYADDWRVAPHGARKGEAA